jgi:hypothetical protein
MKLDESKKVVLLGSFDSDPFIDGSWERIVAEVSSNFPGVDLVSFQMPGYLGLASLTGSLDPMKLAIEMIEKGIMVMGSSHKVNIMTKKQISEFVDMFSDLQP